MTNVVFESTILLYTDPGTGAMLWQLLAAAILGVAFYFRHYSSKIRHTISTKLNKK